MFECIVCGTMDGMEWDNTSICFSCYIKKLKKDLSYFRVLSAEYQEMFLHCFEDFEILMSTLNKNLYLEERLKHYREDVAEIDKGLEGEE